MVHVTNSILAVVLGLSTLSAAARHSTDSEKTYKPSSFGYFEDCKAYTGSDPNPAPIITDEDGFPRYLVKRDIPQANCNHPTKEYEYRNGRLVFVGYKYPSRGVRCGRLPKYRYCLWHSMFGDKKATTGTRNCLPRVVEPNRRSVSTCNCWVEIDHRGGAGTRTCDVLAEDVGATVEQLKEWNPWVGDDCDRGLYAGLGSWETRSVCAGVKGFVPSGVQAGRGGAPGSADL